MSPVRLTLLLRAVFALLILLEGAAVAQELDSAVAAMVRISGTRDDTPVRGSGFVVGLDADKATIVTAAHVIEGVQQLTVTFAADLAESFPAGKVLGMDAGRNGLAVFQVRGASLPADVTSLRFDAESRPALGAALFLLGFPEMAPAPRTAQRVLSARSGTLLLIDQGIGEGFSGGPVLQDGMVVGVLTDTDDQTTYAVNARVAREALEGWGVKLCIPGPAGTVAGIEYVRICPGSFSMGSAATDRFAENDETPIRQVTVSEFWIGRTEVTNAQYRLFRPNHPDKDDALPVVQVTWAEANAACKHFGGRLPTEAEWEYAARAGGETLWSFGADEAKTGDYAWYAVNADDAPHPVATKKPNAWGLYDMHGNVWEWVADGALSQDRLLRGGSFVDPARYLRSANRIGEKPEAQQKNFGFRCAQDSRRQP